jgi:hypothetical protein
MWLPPEKMPCDNSYVAAKTNSSQLLYCCQNKFRSTAILLPNKNGLMFGQTVFWGLSLRPGTNGGFLLFYILHRARARNTRAKKGCYSRYLGTKQPVCKTVTSSYSPHFGATFVATEGQSAYTAAVFQNTAAVFQNTAAV